MDRKILMERLVKRVEGAFNEEALRSLLEIRADAKLQRRIDKLADKCNEGTLTRDERDEYEQAVMLGTFVATLKARARKLLRTRKLSR